ncbi:MAG: UDP-N-acetyl-D-mannosamine dehydrogenase [Propionibacteriaceae bacterium]|nr:UDP-N-acetyl-D-mannosamine dehydrogenase [Propionibacteriaceae bacterium]
MGINTLCVIGLGYIGLPTSVVFADHGVRVYGVDVRAESVAAINAGQAPFIEADLAQRLSAVVESGMLTASMEPCRADATIIAVPTPFLADKSADLSYIQAAVTELAPYLYDGALVILESTSPPGATQKLGTWIAQARPDLVDDSGNLSVDIAHCPERVLPGRVMVELVTNDRIVGGLTPAAAARAQELYSIISKAAILPTDSMTAEMAKCVENSFRDVNIAFANELSVICDNLGIDVWEVIELANHHPRVNILSPGPGVGGHCVAVDPWFIVAADPSDARIIKMAREVNDDKPGWVVKKVQDAAAGKTAPIIAALGLAFKPNIDDLRESPARHITGNLAKAFPQGRILVVEPNITQLPAELEAMPNVELSGYAQALEQAEIVVLLVDHAEFLEKPALTEKIDIIDTRGIWR